MSTAISVIRPVARLQPSTGQRARVVQQQGLHARLSKHAYSSSHQQRAMITPQAFAEVGMPFTASTADQLRDSQGALIATY